MVDFTLTDEQKALREMAHDFAAKEMRPVAWEFDRDGTWPQKVLEKAWELGLMNFHIGEEYGGPGISAFDGALLDYWNTVFLEDARNSIWCSKNHPILSPLLSRNA